MGVEAEMTKIPQKIFMAGLLQALSRGLFFFVTSNTCV